MPLVAIVFPFFLTDQSVLTTLMPRFFAVDDRAVGAALPLACQLYILHTCVAFW